MKKFDPLGLQTGAETMKTGVDCAADLTKKATESGIKAAEGFLKSVCVPALEELGLMLRDRVQTWRINNIINVINKSQGKISLDDQTGTLRLNPRSVIEIMENASLCDDNSMQELWAGLIASSAKNGDRNIIYIDLLKQLTASQARFIEYLLSQCKVTRTEDGEFTSPSNVIIKTEVLKEIFQTGDIQAIDVELDHLSSIDLIDHGFGRGDATQISTTPTDLCLNLFMRANGFTGKAVDYYAKTGQ